MKTKSLTFLLSLTFLFLFSGNSFGGVFDKEDEIASLWCQTKPILEKIDQAFFYLRSYEYPVFAVDHEDGEPYLLT